MCAPRGLPMVFPQSVGLPPFEVDDEGASAYKRSHQ